MTSSLPAGHVQCPLCPLTVLAAYLGRHVAEHRHLARNAAEASEADARAREAYGPVRPPQA